MEKADSVHLEKSLTRFFQPDLLNNSEPWYNCTSCAATVPASKTFSINSVPNVLTLQLKKFDTTTFPITKIKTHVTFEEDLDIGPHTTSKESVKYHLYAVLCHKGPSCNSGHYKCYTKAADGGWYHLNDALVLLLLLCF